MVRAIVLYIRLAIVLVYILDNTIIIPRGADSYLIAYGMGVLVGLGIDYRVNRGSQIYQALNERRRERKLMMAEGKSNFVLERVTGEDVEILNGKGLNDCKVDVKVIHCTT